MGLMESDIAKDIREVVADTLLGVIPVDPFTAGAMSLGVQILRMFEDTKDPMSTLISEMNDVILDILDCIDQKIAKSEAEDQIDSMEAALGDYSIAMGTSMNSTVESKPKKVADAWVTFTGIEYKLNNIIGKDPINFETVLGPLQYFSGFFAVTAIDYLRYLWKYDTDKTNATYYSRLDKTLQAMDVISIWTQNLSLIPNLYLYAYLYLLMDELSQNLLLLNINSRPWIH